MSRLGLALDSPYLTTELLRAASESITQTRDGLPARSGCRVRSAAAASSMTPPTTSWTRTLSAHRQLCQSFPRGGDGEDVFISPVTAGV